MYRVNVERALFIGSLMNKIKEFVNLIEKNDPQYLAVSDLLKYIGTEKTAVIVVANALISYQLTSRGEIYWSALSKWFIHRKNELADIYEIMKHHIAFLESTKYNKLGLKYKIKRLQKFYTSNLSKILFNHPLKYCDQLDKLIIDLSRAMNASAETKTIVFSGKMYYYLCMASGINTGGEIPLPVDRRNSFLTITSCLVKGCRNKLSICIKELMSPRNRGVVIEAWKIVSKKANMPLHKLDAFTWLITGIIRGTDSSPDEIYKVICRKYNYCKKELLVVLKELTLCKDKYDYYG